MCVSVWVGTCVCECLGEYMCVCWSGYMFVCVGVGTCLCVFGWVHECVLEWVHVCCNRGGVPKKHTDKSVLQQISRVVRISLQLPTLAERHQYICT